jgi:hypothetical protein
MQHSKRFTGNLYNTTVTIFDGQQILNNLKRQVTRCVTIGER